MKLAAEWLVCGTFDVEKKGGQRTFSFRDSFCDRGKFWNLENYRHSWVKSLLEDFEFYEHWRESLEIITRLIQTVMITRLIWTLMCTLELWHITSIRVRILAFVNTKYTPWNFVVRPGLRNIFGIYYSTAYSRHLVVEIQRSELRRFTELADDELERILHSSEAKKHNKSSNQSTPIGK